MVEVHAISELGIERRLDEERGLARVFQDAPERASPAPEDGPAIQTKRTIPHIFLTCFISDPSHPFLCRRPPSTVPPVVRYAIRGASLVSGSWGECLRLGPLQSWIPKVVPGHPVDHHSVTPLILDHYHSGDLWATRSRL